MDLYQTVVYFLWIFGVFFRFMINKFRYRGFYTNKHSFCFQNMLFLKFLFRTHFIVGLRKSRREGVAWPADADCKHSLWCSSW